MRTTRLVVLGLAAVFAGVVTITRMARARARRSLPVHHDHPTGKWLKQKRNARKAERVEST